jgi:ATP-dependent DNA ligase
MNLYELISFCRNESGKLEKRRVLTEYLKGRNGTEIGLLKQILDPQCVSGVGAQTFKEALKQSITNKFLGFQAESVDACIHDLKGRTGGDLARKLTEWLNAFSEENREVCAIVLLQEPIGFSADTLDECAEAAGLKKIIDKQFQVQLANSWSSKKEYKGVDHWIGSRKLDGVRCYWRNGKLLSRQNKPFVGFDDVCERLTDIAEQFCLDVIDGELYKTGMKFGEVSSIVSDKNPNDPRKKTLNFNIFAILGGGFKDTNGMDGTMSAISGDLVVGGARRVEIVETFNIPNDAKSIREFSAKCVEEGYEGAMLRHPVTHYAYKRTNDLLKVKLFIEDDFVITGSYEGKNKNTGKLGGVSVKNAKTTIQTTTEETGEFALGEITCDVGGGFSDKLREELWKDRNALVGKTISVKYFEVSQDKKKSGFSLRFPEFLGFKNDR